MESHKLAKIICLSISLAMVAMLLYYLADAYSKGYGWSLYLYAVTAIPIPVSIYLGLREGDDQKKIASVIALSVVLVILANLPRAAHLIEIGVKPSDLSAVGEYDQILSSAIFFAILFIPSMAIASIEGEGLRGGLKSLGLKPGEGIISSVSWGLLITVITFAVVMIAQTIMILVSGYMGHEILTENPVAEQISSSLLLVVTLPVLAGVSEEIFFRGVLQPRFGIMAQAVIFGLAHTAYLVPQQVILPMIMAVVWGWTYRVTGDLRIVITAHVAYDFIVMSLLYFLG